MQNDFPRTEKVEFEEIYGQKRSEAFPHRSENVFNMREMQVIECKQADVNTRENVFGNTSHKEIEDVVVERSRDGYVSLSKLSDLDYDIEDILLVYKMLEHRRVINAEAVVNEPSRRKREKRGKVWSKAETLKLLEAIESYGDDWEKVSRCVGRTKAGCILQFLKMDFGLNKLIAANEQMSQVIFLASRVHPFVGSAAAREFILSYGKKPNWGNIAASAREQMCLEKSKIDRLEKVMLESEILKIEQKILDYKQISDSIDKEKAEIRESIFESRKKIQELVGMLNNTKRAWQ